MINMLPMSPQPLSNIDFLYRYGQKGVFAPKPKKLLIRPQTPEIWNFLFSLILAVATDQYASNEPSTTF